MEIAKLVRYLSLSSIPRSHKKGKPDITLCMCNPSAGMAETGRCLELTGQPAYATGARAKPLRVVS